ncbi:MAG: toxic anion resistance protein [Oligoflexia bacterium]|nr:toxic anion resistance protein [Oligoflexia bacterium]
MTEPVTTPAPSNASADLNVLAQMAAQATEEKTEGAVLPTAGVERSADPSRIPELPEVMSVKVGRALRSRLTEEQLRMVKDVAAKSNLRDAMEIDNFGADYQERARSTAREGTKFLKENVKAAELGEVGELAQAMKRKFQELGIGNLNVAWWERLASALPFVKIDKLKKFIDGREKMQDLMGEIRTATQTKAVQVELFYNRLAGKIKDVKGTVAQLTIVGAVVEEKISETEEKYRKECDRLKKLDHFDDEDLENIHQMKQTLTALDMKLAHVKAMRTMLRQSGDNFRMIREGMGIGITKLKNQLQIQDMVWTVKIDEAISIRELQGLNAVVEASEEFTNKLVDINMQNLDKALQTIFAEAGKPGVSVALLEKSAQAQKVLSDSINNAFVENRKKLAQAAQKLDDIEAKFAERGNDLETLMKMLEVVKLDEEGSSLDEAA